MLTLIQHIEIFRNFATEHSQIKSFANGNPSILTNTKHGATGERLQYPILFMDYGAVSGSGNNLQRSYQIYILDRLSKGNINEEAVLSNMQNIGFDLLSYLKNSPPNWTTTLEKSWSLDGQVNAFDDNLAGWVVNVTLNEPFQYNSCDIPFTDTPPEINTSCPQVTIYENDGITVHELVNAGGYFVLPASGGSFTYDVYFDGVDTGNNITVDGTDITINLS